VRFGQRRIGREIAIKVGNTVKIKTSFCMQCPCTSAEINLPLETKCNKECSAHARRKNRKQILRRSALKTRVLNSSATTGNV
jgi:hypothetical protein